MTEPVVPSSDALQAVAVAPVAVYFNVDNAFRNYRGGIFTGPTCKNVPNYNHAGTSERFGADGVRPIPRMAIADSSDKVIADAQNAAPSKADFNNACTPRL